jgi:glycosyltransferase involved in cell wall biosynthesis
MTERSKESMRIALLVPTLRMGGVERVFVHLAKGFLESGLEVDLVVGRTDGGELASELPKEIQIFDLCSRRMLTSIPALVRYLRNRRPEALIAGMTHSGAVAVWARALARVDCKIVATEHNSMSHVVTHGIGIKYLALPYAARFSYSAADYIVAVSDGVAKTLSRLTSIPRERISVIHNPVVSDEMYAAGREPVSHPWFAPGQCPVIISVARLDPQKDLPTLFRAFSILRKKRPVRLLILGEGAERARLETVIRDLGIQDDVSMPGSVANPYPYMKAADVFVLPSLYEGFGVVIVEALAMGTPVVSTRCESGPAEILCDGKYGTLVSVGDDVGMADAIERILDSKHRVDYRAWVDRFSIRYVCSQYLDLIQSKSVSMAAGNGEVG